MRTIARTGTTLFAVAAAALVLTACGEDDASDTDAGGQGSVAEIADDAGAAGTVEEDSASPGDADACALYLADGQALQFAYDEYGSGATGDDTALLDSLETLAGDADQLDAGDVSDTVLGIAQEVSESAGEAVPALEGGAGVEELDATIGGLQSLADTCAEIGAL